MEKMDGMSMDVEKRNIEIMKELFPNIVTEGKIDFEMLRNILGDEVDDAKEKYQLTWSGKAESIKNAQAPSSATLRPCKNKSKDWDTTENLYIEGDNLEVLKQLQKTYFGNVKMIYIDPPYNTGKDFVYKDNFHNSIENYKEQTNQMQSSNPNTSGRFHSDWLNMMYPRLILARNLLSDDGIIFISIDDKEHSNMEKLCDEVFGSDNHLESFHIKVRYENKSLNEDSDFQPVMEYVLLYAKNKRCFIPKKPSVEYDLSKFVWSFEELTAGEEIFVGNKKVTVFKSGEWRITKANEGRIGLLKETWASGSIVKQSGTAAEFLSKYLIDRKPIDGLGVLYKIDNMGEDGLGYRYVTGPLKQEAIRGKFYSGVPLERIEEIKQGVSLKYSPIVNYYDYSADFGNIRHEGGVAFNSGKKPIKLIKNLMDIANVDDGDIVLDFFSGSASTAHAVMDFTRENHKRLQFIMVQLPELDNEHQDYETICDLGEDRIVRSGEIVKKEWEMKKNQEGLLSKEPEEFDIDTGFKVFKLDSTNINPWDNTKELDEQTLFDTAEVFKPDRSKEDVLYEIMLKYGVFDQPASEVVINGKTMYRVGLRHMLVCLEDNIDDNDIAEICKLEPRVVIFKEDGFKDDNAKINAEYNLKKAGVEDVKCI